MLRSMTGYGRARETRNGRDLTVEVRSVNNRYLDISVKLPRAYIFAEDRVKAAVQKAIPRGKVDVFISVDALGAEETAVAVNEPLARSYMDALARLGELGKGAVCPEYCVTDLARLPDVLTVTKAEEDLEALAADIAAVLEQALAAHAAMRGREGEKLHEDLTGRLATVERLVGEVEKRSPQVVAEYREKLTARMQEVLQSVAIDEGRILTEAAIFADKVAVDEETVRLRSHISQFREMLESGESVGRKLDFLLQEMNREANTIGSKGNDLATARMVVDLKAELEKIREQVQNIE